jgi:hypothetical protein
MSTEGLPDFTLPVAITAQLIASLAVDIKSQSIGNLKVDIAAQSLTTLNVAIASSSVTLNVNIASQATMLNVNVTNSQLSINIAGVSSGVTVPITISGQSTTLNIAITNPVDTSGNLKVAVASSVTINVNIASQSSTINVNISSSSVTLNANITNSSLNVNVTNSSLTVVVSGTVNVSVTNSSLNVSITNSTVTLNTYIADFKATIAPTSLLEKGTQKVFYINVTNGSSNFYTVPSGKTAYILTISMSAYNTGTSGYEQARISGYLSGNYTVIFTFWLKYGTADSRVYTGGIVKLNAGDTLYLVSDVDVTTSAIVVIVEV